MGVLMQPYKDLNRVGRIVHGVSVEIEGVHAGWIMHHGPRDFTAYDPTWHAVSGGKTKREALKGLMVTDSPREAALRLQKSLPSTGGGHYLFNAADVRVLVKAQLGDG